MTKDWQRGLLASLNLNDLWSTSQNLLNSDWPCTSSGLKLPNIPGLQVLSITAAEQQNYTYTAPFVSQPSDADPITGLDFCNITVTYTHPGWHDVINIISYLPKPESWNGRFLATGGGGWVTGGEQLVQTSMIPGIRDGFAVSTTDGGHTTNVIQTDADIAAWAHSSPGNVNWPLLMDFSHVALHDMTLIGKALTESFYGIPPKYSYFSGCSQGGRQGHMLAQRYPEDYDGIVAVFPALNWNRFLWANLWPGFLMDKLGAYPRECEFSAITAAAISACDGLDGVEDGLVSRPGLCHFDPHVLVDQEFDCDGTTAKFTKEAADIAQATWEGPRSSKGEFQFHGFGVDAVLGSGLGPGRVSCDDDGICAPVPFAISDKWARYFVMKNGEFDMRAITHEQWDGMTHRSINEFESIIGTNDPNLSAFRQAGGKMLNWHGTADNAIPYNVSTDYYERVLQADPSAADYYRFFLVPGGSHGFMYGPTMRDMLGYLTDWVEKGKTPDVLHFTGQMKGVWMDRIVCPFPQVQHYVGGDMTDHTSFRCV